jgi:hypothetical protein
MIARLSPAAARLLLAFLSRLPNEQFHQTVARSGISETATLLKAQQQLQESGHWLVGRNGEIVCSLYPVGRTTEQQKDRTTEKVSQLL